MPICCIENSVYLEYFEKKMLKQFSTEGAESEGSAELGGLLCLLLFIYLFSSFVTVSFSYLGFFCLIFFTLESHLAEKFFFSENSFLFVSFSLYVLVRIPIRVTPLRTGGIGTCVLRATPKTERKKRTKTAHAKFLL